MWPRTTSQHTDKKLGKDFNIGTKNAKNHTLRHFLLQNAMKKGSLKDCDPLTVLFWPIRPPVQQFCRPLEWWLRRWFVRRLCGGFATPHRSCRMRTNSLFTRTSLSPIKSAFCPRNDNFDWHLLVHTGGQMNSL